MNIDSDRTLLFAPQPLVPLMLAGVLVGCIPAFLAYRHSLVDGLSIRL